jgi:glutaredoxin
MPELRPEVVFYWTPGCANCTRLKGYLTARGVSYRAVNVHADPAAVEAMAGAGLRALPALRVGDRWIAGEEAEVDAALGLTVTSQPPPVPPRALVERCARMLDLASDLAGQLPAANFDDPTPTMAGFVAASRFLSNGAPFVPHGTSKALIHHIAQHGEKTWRLLLASDGLHELGFAIDGSGDYNVFGEPEPDTPMYRVAAKMRLTASDLRAWLRSDREGDGLSRVLQTHRGPRTMLQYLKIQTIGLLQHTRQFVDLLEGLGIQPRGGVLDQDLEGLNMPAGLWD